MPTLSAAVDHRESEQRESERNEKPNLVRRYGSIGIPAVAAAARYGAGGRNPAYAPARQPKTQIEAVD